MTRDREDEELDSVAPLVRLLPREIAPPADLWEGIAARLEPRGQLDHLAASLPTQVDPPDGLWPKIEARIAPRRRVRRATVALAASVAVATAVAVVLGLRLGERHDAEPARGSASLVADEAASDGANAASNVAWLLAAPVVPGDVAASLSGELALVRDERLSIERAIAKEPDNVDLHELWAFTYETELELVDAYGRTVMDYLRDRG
jgi:hypothetical protein